MRNLLIPRETDFYKRFSLVVSLIVSFGLLCAILTAIGGVSFLSLRSIEKLNAAERSITVDEIAILERIAKNVGLEQAEVFRHVAATNSQEIDHHEQVIARLAEGNANDFAAYQKNVENEAEARLYAEVLQARKAYTDRTNQLLALNRAQQKPEAAAFALVTQVPAHNLYQLSLEKILDFESAERRGIAADTTGRIEQTQIVGNILIGLAIVIALGTGATVARMVRRLKRDKNQLQTEIVEHERAEQALAKTNETLQTEIVERKRAEWQLSIQYAISRVLTESSTLKEASAEILQIVCAKLNWQLGEFYTLDRQAGLMRSDDIWSASNPEMDEFVTLTRQTTFARGAGLPGRVWESGKPVWIPDVAADENFPRWAAAKEAGLHSAFSFPILAGKEVIGVVEFFSHEIRQPDEELLRNFAVLGSQLGQFSERKRGEAALRSSEAHTKAIVQASLDCILTIDHEGKILEFNPAAETIFGYPRAKVLGMEMAEVIIPPSLRERHRQGMARYLATGEARVMGKRIEIVAMRSDGSEFPVELAIARLDAEGPPMFTGFIRDITERKRAEEATTRLAAIIESSDDAIVGQDLNGIITSWNRGAEKIFDYTASEMSGNSIRRLVPVDRQDDEHEILAKIRGGESVEHFETIRQTKNGRLIHLAVTVSPIRDATGTVIGMSKVARDITEQKQAEHKLVEQADLLNLAQDAIMVRGMDDRIQFWNHGAEVLYGWTAEEARGQLTSDLLRYEEPVKILAERTLLETGAWSGDCRHLTKQGATVIVRSRWTLVRDEHGQPKSKLVIATDMTEQKKIEEQFLRAQRLESIGTLASGVAHDLNNILVPIMMAAPVLRGEMEAAERERFLDIVETSAQRGADIIKQVLTFARGADGDRTLLQPIYLLEEVSKIAGQTFPKSIALRTWYDENIRPLEADATQLHQVLLNLCINARDAMPNGGDLCLGAENFDVDEHYARMTPGAIAGPYVMLEVTDSGSGIPRQVLDKIFDPFFTTKAIGKGTGLGLSTVAGIVKSHGGFIAVESKPGHTSFRIFLPAKATVDTSTALDEDRMVPRGHGETILLIDDEPSIREVAEVILKSHGYKVLVAEDGPSALAFFARYMDRIAVVVTDLAMPGMGGLMLVRTLRQIEPALKIILSTGGADEAHTAEITALNVDGVLTKPYAGRNLLLKLSHVLHSEIQDAA